MRPATLLAGAALLLPLTLATGTLPTLSARAADSASASNVAATVASKCGACHQLTGPEDRSISTRDERKGPPLFYAGNKFRKDWLARWLVDPVRIRPAGDTPMKHARSTPEGDVIDESKLTEHPRLSPGEAAQVTDYLMTLKPNDKLIAAESYTEANVSPRMGAMDFVKFKGCGGCHMDTAKDGGVSGPELYTAWQRLQPEFIASYIRDPVAWEARSIMPNKHLADGPINKLVNYLRSVGAEKEAEK
ncbi:MAG: c-type cytochrome [Alphaproteobacteria bacterium]|nr:c-type cytochrome [Alphaproteobacteria bacterium]